MYSPDYKEQPLPLIIVEDGKYVMTEQAKTFLSSIPGPIGIVSVAGVYRTGKSYLLNRMILNKNNGFGVGSTINACTKGLWCWGTPIKGTSADGESINVIVIDTEGINALDEESTHDVRIFTLALLASSCFIYNSMGSIDENAIQNLSLVTNLTKNIQLKTSEDSDVDPEEIGQYFPSFFWVVRDFSLQLVDSEGTAINSNEYLDKALTLQKGFSDDVEEKNRIRRLITGFFKDRHCFTFVRPHFDEDKLQHLDELDFKDLRPEFMGEVLKFRKQLLYGLKTKTLNGKKLNGQMYGNVLSSYVSAINQGAVPNIQSAWTYMCMEQCEKSFNESYMIFHREIEERLVPKIPCSLEEFSEITEEAKESCLRSFQEKALGDTQNFVKELKQKMKKKINEVKTDNEARAVEEIKKFVKPYADKTAKKISNQEFKTFSEYKAEMDQMYNFFLEKAPNVVDKRIKVLEFMRKAIPNGAEAFFKKIINESSSMEKLSKEKENHHLKEIEQLKREKDLEKKTASDKMAELDREKIELNVTIQKLQYQLGRVKQDKAFEEEKLEKNLSTRKTELDSVKRQLESKVLEMTQKYEDENRKLMALQKQWEKEQAVFEMKTSQLQNHLDELERKSKAFDSKFCMAANDSEIKLRESTHKYEKIISELEFKLKDLNEAKSELSEKVFTLNEELQERNDRFEKKQKKYKQEISVKTKEIEKLKRDHDLDCRKMQDELERMKDGLMMEQHELSGSNARNEEQVRNLTKMLKEQKDRYQKENELLNQQIEFAEYNANEAKRKLEETRIHFQSQKEALEAQEYMERQEKINEQINTLKRDHQRDMTSLKEEADIERKNLQLNLEILRNDRNDYELKVKLLTEEYNTLKAESEEREISHMETIEKLTANLKNKDNQQAIALMEKESFYEAKLKQVEAELEEMKENADYEQKDSHSKSEEMVTHIKNCYELEKQKLQQRIISDKEKHNKQLNELLEEEERKRQEEVEVLEIECQQIKEEAMMMSDDYTKTIQNMQHDIDLKAKDIFNMDKTIKELREALNKKEIDFTQKYEALSTSTKAEKEAQYSKIDALHNQLNKKGIENLNLAHEKDNLTNTIKKKDAKIQEIENEINSVKINYTQINEKLRKEISEKEKEYLDQKAVSDTSLALAEQENAFKTKKITDLERQVDELTRTSEHRLKIIKEEAIAEFRNATEKLSKEKTILEEKYQKVKKSAKDKEFELEKRLSQLNREKAVDSEKIYNLESRINEVEEKKAVELFMFQSELKTLKESSSQDKRRLTDENRILKEKFEECENRNSNLESKLEKETILSQNKIKHLEEQRDQSRKEKEEANRKCESTIQNYHQIRLSETSKTEMTINEAISKYRSDTQERLHQLNQKVSLRDHDLEANAKKYDSDIKNLTEKLALETQAKNILQSKTDKKITDLEEKLNRVSEEAELLRKDRDAKAYECQKGFEVEKEAFKMKAREIENKCRLADKQKTELYYEKEKERSVWKMEKENMDTRLEQLKDKVTKCERETNKLQRENERLRNEKKTNKGGHSFLGNKDHSFLGNKYNGGNAYMEEKKAVRVSNEQEDLNKENLKDNSMQE